MRVFSPVNVFISEKQAYLRCMNPSISETPTDDGTSAYRFFGYFGYFGYYFWY
jgi:hypothetical protein